MSKASLIGLASVRDQLRAVGAELGAKALGGAARAAFKRVAETAKQLVPVDEGGLRDAISIRVVRPSGGDTVVAAGIVVASSTTRSRQANVAGAAFGEGQSKTLPPSRRWHFVELGTVHQPARPYLRPALDTNASAVVQDLAGQLRKKIAAALKKK